MSQSTEAQMLWSKTQKLDSGDDPGGSQSSFLNSFLVSRRPSAWLSDGAWLKPSEAMICQRSSRRLSQMSLTACDSLGPACQPTP